MCPRFDSARYHFRKKRPAHKRPLFYSILFFFSGCVQLLSATFNFRSYSSLGVRYLNFRTGLLLISRSTVLSSISDIALKSVFLRGKNNLNTPIRFSTVPFSCEE